MMCLIKGSSLHFLLFSSLGAKHQGTLAQKYKKTGSISPVFHPTPLNHPPNPLKILPTPFIMPDI